MTSPTHSPCSIHTIPAHLDPCPHCKRVIEEIHAKDTTEADLHAKRSETAKKCARLRRARTTKGYAGLTDSEFRYAEGT